MVHPWIVGESEAPRVELGSVGVIRSASNQEAKDFNDDLAREVEEHRRLIDRGDEPDAKRPSGEEEEEEEKPKNTLDAQIGRKGK
jgi:hypothetical protein